MAENNPEMADNEGKGEKPILQKTDSESMRQLDKGISEMKEKLENIEESDGFPTDLSGFKYEFNKNGELRHIETGMPFEFKVKEDMKYNQLRYEAIGEVITEEIYKLLETKGNLEKHYVPQTAKPDEPQSFIYMSKEALDKDKLLVIIHGSGVVRAGQWTRKLIINEDLDHGTQLPYIRRGMDEGYGVVVLNTNLNKAMVKGSVQKIKGNSSPEDHGIHVWLNFIGKSNAKHIAVVAHSFGGVVTTAMCDRFRSDFEKRVFAIAFTDSVHGIGYSTSSVGKIFAKKARNWVTSDKPIDTVIRASKTDAPRVSAGHEKHEWTSWSSFESVFKFFDEKFPKQSSSPEKSPSPKKKKEESAAEATTKDPEEKESESVEKAAEENSNSQQEEKQANQENKRQKVSDSEEKQDEVVGENVQPDSEEPMDTAASEVKVPKSEL